MKKLILILAAIAALMLIIIPVSANDPTYVGPIYYGENITVQQALPICLQAGYSGIYLGTYTSVQLIRNHYMNGNNSLEQHVFLQTDPRIFQIPSANNGDYYIEYAACAPAGANGYGNAWKITAGTRPPLVNVTFSISESGNFTHKISGALITLSNGQTHTTGSDGTALIGVTPNSSTYTYSLSKNGYWSEFGSLGGYGETGGTIYLTMEPGPNVLPPGWVETTVHGIDSTTGNHIVDVLLNVKAVNNGTWTNVTAHEGISYIQTLSNETLNIYGSLPGFYSANSELGVTAGGDYYLALTPSSNQPAPNGYVNLYVTVIDGTDGSPVKHAEVGYSYGGITQSSNTGTSGTASRTVANNTAIILSVSKAGYKDMSKPINSGTGADVTTTITISKTTSGTVGPTPTPDCSSGSCVAVTPTPLPTILPYCDPSASNYDADMCIKSQDSSIMAKIRENAPMILDLAIAAIMFGLLGMIFSTMTRFGK